MSKITILLIDDDEILLELLGDHVRMAGYAVLTAQDGTRGLELVSQGGPDLVVLDVMMPGMDGWQVCKLLRERSKVPIIMLTAKGEEIDKLRGFRLGVDDYVTKPFSFAELIARIKAILIRSQIVLGAGGRITSGDLTVDINQRRVSVEGSLVDLSPTEYRLLEMLARHANLTVPTEQLLSEVWGLEYADNIDHVKHYIWSLRKKIEADPGTPTHILTERGFGYRFE